MTDEDDWEFHSVLEEMAPAAARTLLELAQRQPGGIREEAVRRLRQMQASGLFDELPLDLRHQAEALLGDDE